MRTFQISTGFLSIALALMMSMPAAAQGSTPSSAQHDPSAAPPSQSAPSASPANPSQPAPGQAVAGTSATPEGRTSSQAQTQEENPLNLTDEQKTKLRPILIEQNQKMEALRNDSSLTQEQKIAKANEIREVASPKIKAILTPEQLQKLTELQQKAKQPNQSAPADHPPQK